MKTLKSENSGWSLANKYNILIKFKCLFWESWFSGKNLKWRENQSISLWIFDNNCWSSTIKEFEVKFKLNILINDKYSWVILIVSSKNESKLLKIKRNRSF
jgi:hypothetical protein